MDQDYQGAPVPPPELVREWSKGCSPYDVPADHIATQAARWGADQELERQALSAAADGPAVPEGREPASVAAEASPATPPVPPPELIRQWSMEAQHHNPHDPVAWNHRVAAVAARWGADQELEACCADVHTVHGKQQADWLRSLRRPKPPSLKEQALGLIDSNSSYLDDDAMSIIRRALESLPD